MNSYGTIIRAKMSTRSKIVQMPSGTSDLEFPTSIKTQSKSREWVFREVGPTKKCFWANNFRWRCDLHRWIHLEKSTKFHVWVIIIRSRMKELWRPKGINKKTNKERHRPINGWHVAGSANPARTSHQTGYTWAHPFAAKKLAGGIANGFYALTRDKNLSNRPYKIEWVAMSFAAEKVKTTFVKC